jgi:hypothetical protein
MPTRRGHLLLAAFPLPLLVAAPVAAEERGASQLVRPTVTIFAGAGGALEGDEDRSLRPLYLLGLGLGGRRAGVELRALSNGPPYGFPGRAGADVTLVVRPLAIFRPEWEARGGFSLGLAAGVGLDQLWSGSRLEGRPGLVLGAHVDLPLGARDGTPAFFARVGARRLFAPDTEFEGAPPRIGDAHEAFAALGLAL